MPFQKAVAKQGKARIALIGGPGDGKTWTALVFATALADGGPIGFIDTEHGSASKYATAEPGDGLFDFDVMEPDNFRLESLLADIGEAARERYPVLCVDSMSHYWSGKGGALDVVGGNFNKWKDVTPVERRVIDALVSYPGHVIVCMRAKSDYVDVVGGNGKTKKEKVGFKPDQREGIEFEFDVVAYMHRNGDGVAMTVEKTRCPALHGEVFLNPNGETLEPLRAWLNRGEPDDTEYWAGRIHDATDEAALMVIYNDMKERGVQGRWTSQLTVKKEALRAEQRRLLKEAEAKALPDGEWGELGSGSDESAWQAKANDLLGKAEEFEQLVAWATECGTLAFIEAHVKLHEEELNAPM